MTKRKILGVCAWLADKFGLDVGGLRILFVAAAILGFGSPVKHAEKYVGKEDFIVHAGEFTR